LKQFSENFNISAAWKDLVGWGPNSDRLLQWSEENAAILKQKLEFRLGNPEQLAYEARRLEKSFRPEDSGEGWSVGDLRIGSSVSPALLTSPGISNSLNVYP
jgi:hypothetical protein